MDRTLRVLVIVVGVALFVVAAGSSFGWWWEGAPVTGLALLGFACWLGSTLP